MKISCLHDRYCIASFEPALSPESGEINIILSALKRAETMGYTGGLRESNQYDRMLGSTGRFASSPGSTCARIRARGHSFGILTYAAQISGVLRLINYSSLLLSSGPHIHVSMIEQHTIALNAIN
jgi:hypothetical protein